MKRISAIWICLILLFSSTSVYIDAVTSSLGLDDTPLSPGPGPQPGAQVYYTNRATFDADAGPLPFLEDFEEANIPPIGPGTINGTLDENTNDGYFIPGDIEPGIRFQDKPGPDPNGYGVLDAGVAGNPSKTVCTNFFTDSMDITFFNNDVWAVGMELQSYFGACTPTIKIYTTGDVLLDTVTAPADNTGIFWGVISDELITRINIYDASNTDGADNIAFGQPLGTIDHIEVNPNPAMVVVGDTQQFTATAYDQFNNTIPGVDFLWSTNVGAVDSSGFFFAQTTPNIGYVNATSGAVTGTANVTVVVGDIDHIIVIPDPAFVIVDMTQQFTATAYDIYNNVIPGIGFNWVTDVGVINATGFFTAQSAPGIGTIAVSNGTVTGSANVMVVEAIFDIDLILGWNLISIPLVQFDESIDQVLISIDGKWDCIRAYDAVNDKWLSNITSRPDCLNDLKTLNHKMGFWINITEPGVTLMVGGSIPGSTSINLYAGWNLVCYPSLTNETVANALWGTGADRVEVFDSAEPYRIREVGPSYVMKPGEGYWIHVPTDTVWVVDW